MPLSKAKQAEYMREYRAKLKAEAYLLSLPFKASSRPFYTLVDHIRFISKGGNI